MFSKIRRRLTYANVAATLALLFAMSGGAYAAGHFLITSTKQIKPTVLKQLQGKAGKAGVNGAQGPAGPAGAQGPGGAQGPAGPAGPTGATGATGASGAAGPAGKNGTNGTTGFTETLPAGKTLKGQWDLFGEASAEHQRFRTSASYGIPLAEAPRTHYIAFEGADPAGCSGDAEEPSAEPGNLCIFAKEEENSVKGLSAGPIVVPFPTVCDWETGDCNESSEGTGGKSGFGVEARSAEAGLLNIVGTWAVTAAE